MAVLAKYEVTVYHIVEISAVYRFYKLQASTLAAPSKPSDSGGYPPDGWETSEPEFSEDATSSLYTVECTVLTDGSYSYSAVSLSSSYEAAKTAYNSAIAAGASASEALGLAQAAQDAAADASGSLAGVRDDLDTTRKDLEDLQNSQKDLMTIAQFETYKTDVEKTSTEVNTVFTTDIGKLREDLTTEIETRSGLIRMAMEGLGDDEEAGVEIGVSNSELTSLFTNKRLTFMRNNIAIITLSAEKEMLDIKSVEIAETLQQGGFQWRTRANGNLGLVWVGGDD